MQPVQNFPTSVDFAATQGQPSPRADSSALDAARAEVARLENLAAQDRYAATLNRPVVGEPVVGSMAGQYAADGTLPPGYAPAGYAPVAVPGQVPAPGFDPNAPAFVSDPNLSRIGPPFSPDNDTRLAELESRVNYLYDALSDQIAYHGQRNGPVAGTPAGGTGGLSI